MIHELVHHGECVVRTPLLPFDVLLDHLTRERLRAVVENPIVREALFLASPTLDAALDAWLETPNAPRASHVEIVLFRYVSRMATRPTPFGLFSGCAVARIAPSTSLAVGVPRECRRSSRLDTHYLTLLAESIQGDRAVRQALRVQANSSITRGEDELRYVEATMDTSTRARQFHLVMVDPIPELAVALDAAHKPTTCREICDSIVRHDSEVSREEAAAFVDALLDAQILESKVHPAVTGENLLGAYANALTATGATSAIGERLMSVERALDRLDGFGLGAPRDAYRAIAAELEELPVQPDPARLFQVDLFKSSAGLHVGESVVAEVRRSIALLHGMTPHRGTAAMRYFRTRFEERYGEREISLAEALDDEGGLGFDLPGVAAADPSPLLVGLVLPDLQGKEPAISLPDRRKLHRVLGLLASGEREWALDDADLAALQVTHPAPLPDALAALVSIGARCSEAVDLGEFQLCVHDVGGPSGAKLLARFCHGDPAIRALVGHHLRAEERLRPEAIFAEIVHLPEGRLGNILCRPVLRSHEIPYLGVSGVPSEQQIPIDDLRVSVRGGAVRLRSARLGREVLPRLSSAHDHSSASLAVYRFLCELQYEGVASSLHWDWGPLEGAPFLPRVRQGRVILSLATWTVENDDVEHLARDAAYRARRGLPRWVCVVEGDHLLPLDLETETAAPQLVALARGRERIRLRELFPSPENMCAAGPDGRYAHEIIIPLVRAKPSTPKSLRPICAPSIARTFCPGTEWLYMKLYTGPASQDRVLRAIIAPALNELRAGRAIERWFFIRYADPEPHLRVRFQGDADRLLRHVLPLLRDRLARPLASGRVARYQLDTYEREIERYGGSRTMLLAEQIFCADSDLALAIVHATTGDAGADIRWRAALYGMHMILTDAEVGHDARRALVARARDAFAAEHRLDTPARRSLGARYRTERADVERLLGGAPIDDDGLGALMPMFRARSATLVPLLSELRKLRDAGELEAQWDDLLRSFIHMHVNRIIRDNQRPHELVLYEFLLRTYESMAARARTSAPSRGRSHDGAVPIEPA
ncbi:lantibiotic dehydratase [Pendulispora albinea]|uniref:Lantibiotic dehydratase n=1 Tax=Pendulispora albinea TaxID=2741071 RepID=A0ABZ2M2Q8_9BACT